MLFIGDTDSIKLKEGFDENIINDYNKNVEKKLYKISKLLKINFENYKPKDKKGKEHLIGLFESDGDYAEFITQRSKKVLL